MKRRYCYSPSGSPDDRPLYWARIKMEVALKSHPFFVDVVARGNLTTNTQLNTLIWKFEELSRNYTGIDFSGAPAEAKKILLNGFDPYGLFAIPTRSNPSGTLGLALHGTTIEDNNGNKAIIQTSMFPVRFQDFNNGVVEKWCRKFLDGTIPIDGIPTVSLNPNIWMIHNNLNIERFAGRNRGKGYDNLNRQDSVFPKDKSGEEFYESKLPFPEMIYFYNNQTGLNFGLRYHQYAKYKNLDMHHTVTLPNNYVSSLDFNGGNPILNEDHYKNPPHLPSNIKSLEGSGGNYLSNEIMYRVARIREKLSPSTPTGHIHVPPPSVGGNPDIIQLIKAFKNAIFKV